ncbi:Dom-3 Z [Podila humilis]|nr:Dom-3 Z [Podila humilis]
MSERNASTDQDRSYTYEQGGSYQYQRPRRDLEFDPRQYPQDQRRRTDGRQHQQQQHPSQGYPGPVHTQQHSPQYLRSRNETNEQGHRHQHDPRPHQDIQYQHQHQHQPHQHRHHRPPPIHYQPGQTFPRPVNFPSHGQPPPPQHHQHRSYAPLAYENNQFPVQPLDRFKVPCAPFRQPIEIGSFSYDEQRNFLMDDTQLKYYYPPDLSKPNNLSVNYEKYISRDLMVDEHIDALLDALICIKDREEKEQEAELEAEGLNDGDGDKVVEDEALSKHNSSKPTADAFTPSGSNASSSSSSLLQQQAPQKPRVRQVSMTKADFICYRGILTKIMCTPYTRNEPWELGATLYKGSIYLEEHVTDERRQSAGGTSERHKLMSYWGYRFETICNISKPVSELKRLRSRKRRAVSEAVSVAGTSKPGFELSSFSGNGDGDDDDGTDTKDSSNHKDDNNNNNSNNSEEYEETDQVDMNDPELLARLDGIVDTNLQYCTVARTKIGQNSIIMGAEVDCTSEPKKPSPHNPLSNYIELKTSRVISNSREQASFEKHKLLKFWAQSFLPGIPTIIVGFRDDDGNVVQVQTFKTMEIPRLVRGKEGAWDTTICINFLDSVLSFLKKLITKDNPSLTYTIRWAFPFKTIDVEFAGPSNPFLTKRFLDRWSRSQQQQ